MYSGLKEANKDGQSGPPKAPKREPLLAKYFLSCVAATVAETATYPLDLTKTRLQIQGEFSGKQAGSGKVMPYRGLLATLYGIVREEGFFRLWQGVSPAVIRHIPYTGLRISLYEVLRERIQRYNGDGTVHFWQTVTCGMTAGGFGQFVSSPTDLVKVQMQMEGKRRLLGHPPRYRTVWHAFATVYNKIGFFGMWRGAVPNVQRAMLVNMGELTTYDTVKHRVLMSNFPETFKDDHLTHAISSVCSGLVAAVLGTPADVIKTRVMNNVYHSIANDLVTTNGTAAGSAVAGNTNVVVYRGALDCFLKTVRNEGFFALYVIYPNTIILFCLLYKAFTYEASLISVMGQRQHVYFRWIFMVDVFSRHVSGSEASISVFTNRIQSSSAVYCSLVNSKTANYR